jgi:hypothetical protein
VACRLLIIVSSGRGPFTIRCRLAWSKPELVLPWELPWSAERPSWRLFWCGCWATSQGLSAADGVAGVPGGYLLLGADSLAARSTLICSAPPSPKERARLTPNTPRRANSGPLTAGTWVACQPATGRPRPSPGHIIAWYGSCKVLISRLWSNQA